MLRENYVRLTPGRNVVWDDNFIEMTLNCYKLNDLNMITIMDLCESGKITIGSIEGGPIENKITVLSHCVGD